MGCDVTADPVFWIVLKNLLSRSVQFWGRSVSHMVPDSVNKADGGTLCCVMRLSFCEMALGNTIFFLITPWNRHSRKSTCRIAPECGKSNGINALKVRENALRGINSIVCFIITNANAYCPPRLPLYVSTSQQFRQTASVFQQSQMVQSLGCEGLTALTQPLSSGVAMQKQPQVSHQQKDLAMPQ